ncbi:hypothetical protein PLICRDRAFT_47690 [Plicaturopsis crispa FD-325 SS-3]|nr:hypothetical protein PLICRDRAFT_47690 [Plicaturopsis crispa FD-325 SS-3]
MSREDPKYVDRKTVAKSYRPESYLMSPGLKRAREPFRVRNAVTGVILAAFGVGVWAYSISAVKQDVFDDIDEEARALGQSGLRTEGSAEATNTAANVPVAPGIVSPPPTIVDVQPSARVGRGVLLALDKHLPGLLDPTRKTLVWGAPPVDRIGRISDGPIRGDKH